MERLTYGRACILISRRATRLTRCDFALSLDEGRFRALSAGAAAR
jgi:hypothetical protein